jgi:transposase-like protein/ribosomal protein L37AE/L43A
MGKKKFWRMLDEMLIKGMRAVMPIISAIPEQCKFCGSPHIVRYGHYQTVQRWWCKDCRRKFVHNEALPRMKTPVIQVASALSSFYEGMSIRGIRRNIGQTFGNYPYNAAIYGWIQRFTKVAIEAARDYKPDVGDVWIADETVLKIEGENLWFWDIIDQKTRFLLASHVSTSRTTRDAKALVERAAERAGKPPKVIITDKLAAYLDGIELAFGGDTKHLPAKRLTVKDGTQIIERFHGTLKARTKVMRGLKTRKSARLITDGYLVHYNFFRPHEALKTKSGEHTPAEKAGIKFPFRNWLDIVKGR